jgi:hypothetical protein
MAGENKKTTKVCRVAMIRPYLIAIVYTSRKNTTID